MTSRGRAASVAVVHVTARYPPSLGGMEKVAESLVMSRLRQNRDVTVLTSRPRRSGPAPRGPGRRHADGRRGAGVVRRLPAWEVAHTPIIWGLPAALLRLPRHSVVHLHIAQAFVPEAVLAAHLLRRLPYVAHLHLDVGPSGPAGFLLRAYKPLVLRPVLRAARSVVVFTDEQRAAVQSRYGVDPARIAVIPNAVDETFAHPRRRRALHPRPRLLFVGRLAVQKNLLLLLQALDGVSGQFETTLAGAGEREAELRAAARDLRLRNVRFAGRVDGASLRELYRDADVFVLPSEREGMPLVLLEALAMGLPIVATDIPGTREMVVPGENGLLVPPGDAPALRRALLQVTSDATAYARMSEASRRRAGRYSRPAVDAAFERLYASAGAGRRPRL